MVAFLEWLLELPFYWRQRVIRRFIGQDDEWVDEIVATIGAELGLPVVRSAILRPLVRGTLDGRRVAVEAWTVLLRGSEPALRFRVVVATTSKVHFGPRTPMSARGPRTGDELFDAGVAVSGAAGAWFDHRTRVAMERVVHNRGGLGSGQVVVDNAGYEFVGAHDVLEVVRHAIESARRLEGPRVTALDVARADPDPQVRLAALDHLVAAGPDAALLRELATDADPRVAARSARALGAEGHDRLRHLLPTEGALDALIGLSPVLVPGDDPAVDRAVIALVTASPTREVLEIAGLLGGVSVVAPLLRVSGPEKERARSAVRTIQARLAGERGGVSLGPDTSGALAEAAEDGRLTKVDDAT